MKYINGKELMMFLEQPVTRISVFQAETMDAILVMCADAFPKLEQEFHVTIDFPTFKFQLMKRMQEFIYECKDCKHKCLENPRARIAEERYIERKIKLPLWPEHIQKTNAENFFIIEYTLAYADILYRYLIDSGIPQELAHQLATQGLDMLALWIDENCIKKCDYECIRRSNSNGYCALCSFMLLPLPCPKKGEISYRQLRLDEEDIQCMRRE